MSGRTLSNGQILPPPVPMHIPKQSNVPGGALEAAAAVTINSRNHQIATAKAMGVGQKGGANAPASTLPTAGSIPGVDPTNTHIRNVDNLNAIRAARAGDALANAAPYYPAKKGGRRTKHGRGRTRAHRRRNHKSSRSRRRSRRRI